MSREQQIRNSTLASEADDQEASAKPTGRTVCSALGKKRIHMVEPTPRTPPVKDVAATYMEKQGAMDKRHHIEADTLCQTLALLRAVAV